MSSGNGQTGPYLYHSVPAFTTSNNGSPDHYQTTYDRKTKIVVFYSLINNAFPNTSTICEGLHIFWVLRIFQHVTFFNRISLNCFVHLKPNDLYYTDLVGVGEKGQFEVGLEIDYMKGSFQYCHVFLI